MDTKTQANLIQWPIEETEKLRSEKYDEFKNVELLPGSLIPLNIGMATQVTLISNVQIFLSILIYMFHFYARTEIYDFFLIVAVGHNCDI